MWITALDYDSNRDARKGFENLLFDRLFYGSTDQLLMAYNTLDIESKLPAVGTSIFSIMSEMARKYNAINLSQGFPDFPVDPEIIGLVRHYMEKGHNQYAPSSGIYDLREKISHMKSRHYGHTYDPETEITITSGATEALYCAFAALLDPEDEVILFDPAYDSYAPAVVLNGGVPIHIPLKFPEYRIDWEMVKKYITQRTRIIVINTPHNPTGAVISAEDLEELNKIVSNNEIFLIGDDVYEHITFDKAPHHSLATHPDLRKRSFVISSFGKSMHATGWKVGYCAAPAEMMNEFRKVHQFVTFATNTPVQFALADYLDNPDRFNDLGAFYQEKRDFFRSALSGSRFDVLDCSGTYFQLLSYSRITDEKDVSFASRLTKEHGIASIPVSVFYRSGIDNHVLRFCFAKKEETLERAAAILHKV